ncbi:MAG: UDP-N-acetylmuramoyl-tripeptide--D-alanyl-D-alanine ligase [Gammaproteobacteria bacterium]|nr:UDP-N-acetylmuramoyl-tripeptide--D-alanyl-D-alanine ligase [Gammaproteobacteria bacterium]MDA8010892.1 UDP-N-acetylmuramoyl-tripeptide--D-alanyl-D-alanine ligase [Gammaproteobacteria bacterium]
MMRLSEAAAVTRGALRGADAVFEGVAIDSRRAARGDLFVAIGGARRDGHDFIAQAREAGAAGALVSRARARAGRAGGELPHVAVGDTTEALGRLGAHWRGRFDIPLVAVTGSNGKTSVTAMLASIFSRAGKCLAPRASFNNQWGVPLTLLRLRAHHTHAVVEMGMNRAGEIEKLCALARPRIALVTNVAPAHLAGAGLKNLQGVAEAKAEIFSHLAHDGVAVLNADDRFHAFFAERAARHKRLSFGIDGRAPADVRARECAQEGAGSAFELCVGERRARVRLRLLGAHNVRNALAAAAAAHAAGAALGDIRDGLEAFRALPGRLRELPGPGGAVILDDAYNANPASLKAALDVLSRRAAPRIAVLGAMAELGARSEALHFDAGAYARQAGVARLFCFGPADQAGLAGYMRGFGDGAKRVGKLGALLSQLQPLLAGNDGASVLVKGSRAAAMERVVEALASETAPAQQAGGAAC